MGVSLPFGRALTNLDVWRPYVGELPDPAGIAAALAPDFLHVPNAELVAVASRDESRAREFASHHGVATAHGSYRALLDDPTVDAIYIATPHPLHYQLALAAVAAGKHILVEKSFTATLAGTVDLIANAEARGVFCMEAMWTRFQPAVVAAREVIAWGRIGEVVGVQGDLNAFRRFSSEDRLFSPSLGAAPRSTWAFMCSASPTTSSVARTRSKPPAASTPTA